MLRRRQAVGIAFLAVIAMLPAIAGAQSGPASGTWMVPGSEAGRWNNGNALILELTQLADSVQGQLLRSSANGPAASSLPVWGVVRQDSIFLADANGVAIVAAQLKGNLMIGRMGPRGFRTGPNALADAPRVRFVRR